MTRTPALLGLALVAACTNATELGTLALSGPDVAPQGGLVNTFAPTVAAVAPLGAETLVSWEGPEVTGLIVTAEGDRLVDLSYNQEFVTQLDSFFYYLDCGSDGVGCDAVTFDEAARTVVFDAASVPVSPSAPNNNGATGAIRLDGTLRF